MNSITMPKIFAQFFRRVRSPHLKKDNPPETRPKAPIQLLPDELTMMVHRHLDRIDTICLAVTCKDFKNAWLKPQKHPKYLITYQEPIVDGPIVYYAYLQRQRRFWELWRIYSERWELLRRLARDSPGEYHPCFECLMLHWKGSKRRAQKSEQDIQPPRHGRGFAEFSKTYAALESVLSDYNAQTDAHPEEAVEGQPGLWNCICAIATVRRDKRDFRKLLESVWANAPYRLGETAKKSDHLQWYRDWKQRDIR